MNDNIIDGNKILPVNVNRIFEGRYTIIKPITYNELSDRYLSWVNDEKINEYLSVRHKKQNISSLIDYINSVRSRDNCEIFSVFTKKDCIHIGNCTITKYNPNGQGYASYGIFIGDKYSRTVGLGVEVIIVLLEYFFSDPNIYRVNAGVASKNIVAWRTIESLGYIKEGVQRKCMVLKNGERCDIYHYGMLREEWVLHRKKLKKLINSIVISDL